MAKKVQGQEEKLRESLPEKLGIGEKALKNAKKGHTTSLEGRGRVGE